MPLTQSSSDAAWEKNLKAELGAGRKKDQALAIAFETQRRNRHAAGGGIGYSDPVTTSFARGGGIGRQQDPSVIFDQPHPGGIIHGATGGRTDRLPLSVKRDSHIIPADAVSGLGQGGTMSGAEAWARAIRGAPWGVAIPRIRRGPGPPSMSRVRKAGVGHFAQGGIGEPASPEAMLTPDRAPVVGGIGMSAPPRPNTSILAASEEVHVPDDDVEALGERMIAAGKAKPGETALEAGHRGIDEAIAIVREFVIEWTKSAPPPKT